MQNFTQGGAAVQSSGSGDEPGRTWRSLDASLSEAAPEAATVGSGARRLEKG
jgi:hypothetical protein